MREKIGFVPEEASSNRDESLADLLREKDLEENKNYNTDEAIEALTSDLDIETKGKSTSEIADEIEGRLNSSEKNGVLTKISSGKIGRSVRTLMLTASLLTGVGAVERVYAAGAEGSKSEQKIDFNKQAVTEKIRLLMKQAVISGADEEKVNLFIKDALDTAKVYEVNYQGSDAAIKQIDNLYNSVFGVSNTEKIDTEFDKFVKKGDSDFQKHVSEGDSAYDNATKEMSENFEKQKHDEEFKEMDSVGVLSARYDKTVNEKARDGLRKEIVKLALSSKADELKLNSNYSFNVDLLGGVKLEVKFAVDSGGKIEGTITDSKTSEKSELSIEKSELK